MVDQVEQGVQVDLLLTGQLLREVGGKPGPEQALRAPAYPPVALTGREQASHGVRARSGGSSNGGKLTSV